jgi:hypothetical protein
MLCAYFSSFIPCFSALILPINHANQPRAAMVFEVLRDMNGASAKAAQTVR